LWFTIRPAFEKGKKLGGYIVFLSQLVLSLVDTGAEIGFLIKTGSRLTWKDHPLKKKIPKISLIIDFLLGVALIFDL